LSNGDRKRTPIPIPERELRSTGAGPVITYQLSEEELAKYRAMPVPNRKNNARPIDLSQYQGPPNTSQKQSERTSESYKDRVKLEPEKEEFLREIAAGKSISQVERERGMTRNSIYYWVKKWDLIGITPGKAREILKEDVEMESLSKEQYLEMRLNGHSRTSIQKQHFTNPPKFYAQLGEWGIKEKDAEERELDLLQAQPIREEVEELFQPEENKDPNSTYEALKAFSDKNLKDEIKRLNEALETEQRDHEHAVKLLNETKTHVNQLEDEIHDLVDERDATRKYVDSLKQLSVKTQSKEIVLGKEIVLRLPLLDSGANRFDQMQKVHEELEEVGSELETASIDRRRAAEELFDLVQSFVGLIRVELSDLIVDGSVDQHVIRFFEHFNREHFAKIQLYAAERGWRVIEE